jgi:hypothetical protein
VTARKRGKPPRVASVAPMTPPGTDTPGAAMYLTVSPSLLLQMRADDAARVRRGEEPQGPRWHTIGSRVVYLRNDLDAWLSRNLVPFGKTSRGRPPTAPGVGAEP